MPVQRIVLNSALETTVEAAVESPRATISEKIRVRTYDVQICIMLSKGAAWLSKGAALLSRVQRGSVGCSVAQ